MKFNKHPEVEDKHAFLSPSRYHWINYDLEKLFDSYYKYRANEQGTRLHAFACEAIKLGQKLPKNTQTLNMYVNDAIGFKMIPEQPVFYSKYCFGTVDTILFKKNFLRIHDYKSGVTKASFSQLEIYTAIFCLEYNINPNDIEIELRIYQSDEIRIHVPEKTDILYIMSKIIDFDKELTTLLEEEA